LHFDTEKSIGDNLDNIAIISLDISLTAASLYSLEDIFLHFVSCWISNDTIEVQYTQLKGLNTKIKGSCIITALGRIVSLAHQVTPLLEFYLSNNDIFAQINEKLDKISDSELKEVLLAFYRLLYADCDRFLRFISPDILAKILSTRTDDDVTRFLAVQLLAKYLKLSEAAKNDVLKNYVGDVQLISDYENDPNIDFRFLSILEAKRLANFRELKNSPVREDQSSDFFVNIESNLLSPLVVSVCGILVPKIHFDQTLTNSSDFVATERSIKTLRQLSHHVQNGSPVMVVGTAGSGKTFLINELSKYLSCDKTMVKIHLGEQTDAKLLLGTYTSGEKPGTFEWRSGVLTTAVKEGRWVLIEDIDKAPTEVLSILLSLLEKRELTVPSRGEIIKAANGFQLISTIRSSNDLKNSIPDLIGLRLWKILTVEEPSEEELKSMICAKFPSLTNMVPMFIRLYKSIQETYNTKSFLVLNRGSHPRVISVRDLMKFGNRVNVIYQSNGITSQNQLLESSVIDSIFAEAVDCFASAISEQDALDPLIHAIGEALQIPSSRIQVFLKKHVPLYENYDDHFVLGRAHLKKAPSSLYRKKNNENSTSFARTNHSLRLMEQIGVSVQMTEPVLLVGETGTGKTTVVQQVAKQMNKQLTVINVSQQTETGDLLGGYKPINTKTVAVPIQEDFLNLFHLTFSAKKNEKFEQMLTKCFNRNQWKNVIKLWNEAVKLANQVLTKEEPEKSEEAPKKKRRLNADDKFALLGKWTEFQSSVKDFEVQSQTMENAFVFNFVEGALVKAVRNGDWLLLDEINLASPDTLESISDLLSDVASQRSILLSEKGEVESIQAHKDFRIFACMNPATDVGKRDLPISIRSRFTEIYVHSPDGDISDLLQIIDKYISRFAVNDEWVGNDVAQLYLEAKKLAESNQIVDGANQKPHFSIRTLTRTLLYVCDIVSIYGLRRSLFEGFSMSFLTLLDQKSEKILKPLIEKYTIGRLKNAKSVISQIPPAPSAEQGKFVQFKHYWMKQGPFEVIEDSKYIITPFVEKNMLNLVRATSGKRFPILVQGPTSAGKTSMVKYLADITGNKFVRINNHEHTDLQEYLGTYVSGDNGKLSFKEGVLVEALRKGHWLVLDELNLAPTDVLEALNRLLDDNRELFIPETQEVVHPHPDFMLFATQNPPGLYGGRKVLSRAFRNRFLELHFDDIPQDELEIILRERCQIAPSYAGKIVEVYRQLSIQRQSSRLFEQKNSFATLRDLFRWALRDAVGYEQLAANGYMLLAERVRKTEEKLVVKEIMEKVMRVKLNMDEYYESLENKDLMAVESPVVWTRAIRRLAVLISAAIANNEPVLLVGETGCGKTTVCQVLAQFKSRRLITVNAHQNTETGDLLGAQRPVRNKTELQRSLYAKVKHVLSDLGLSVEKGTLAEHLQLYDSTNLVNISEEMKDEIATERNNLNILFEWTDGPLIQALRSGEYFLLDEISLADDSVLERLNSVLEPERSLLLAEKGTDDSFITATDGFQFLATMNPGGDYGKKELSPALRNRFTEIWVPSLENINDLQTIVESKLHPDVRSLASVIVKFSESFGKRLGGGNISSGAISLRDILAWVEFVNSSFDSTDSVNGSLLHGASMVFIDALGTNNTAYLAESEEKLNELKLQCVKELSELVGEDLTNFYTGPISVRLSEYSLKAGLFEVARNPTTASEEVFSFEAPTTAANAMRVIRAMQLKKPILLEGSPGVGKTSLVSAISKATGNPLTRINLSEQTDLVDLFGSDAPVEGGKTGEFVWRDAPFLRAMKEGEWVLLDEMNLASQSVLEGLNACLDHRGEAYIPELDKSFPRHSNFKVFAAQNPQYQGGGRKGLPKSFVNRFTVVYVDTLSADDLVLISHHLYPEISENICAKMIGVVSKLEEEVSEKKLWGTAGGPWEFNLRDTLRWLELYSSQSISDLLSPVDFMNIIVTQRFRNHEDREKAKAILCEAFGEAPNDDNLFVIGEKFIQSRKVLFQRSDQLQLTSYTALNHLQANGPVIESALLALQNNWPTILVGPSNSGKTDLVRYLATLTGSKVVEFSMNSDVDSMDILGGYEQLDLTRQITALVNKLFTVLCDALASHFKGSTEVFEANIACLKLLKFLTSTHINLDNFDSLMERFGSFQSSVNTSGNISAIGREISELSKKIVEKAVVTFEWFDGLLVKAVEQGHWLVLDNANLCSPSVLDRLNSLLEINGSLIINECSLPDGQPRVLKPHKNFRLFLTVDPKFGELSRAMRNRGVEIFLDSLDTRSTSFDKRLMGQESVPQTLTLEDLSIGSASRVTASTYIEATDSASHYLGLLCDLDPTLLESSCSIVATVSPFVSQSVLHAFSNSVTSCTEFRPSFSEFLRGVVCHMEYFSETGLSRAMYSAYSNVNLKATSLLGGNSNFVNYQFLNPVWNSYVYKSVVAKADVMPSELIYLFELASQVMEGLETLQKVELKGQNGKLSELNYLEQSAAAFYGRNMKGAPRLNIFKLLKGSLSFIQNSLTDMTMDAVLSSRGVMEALHRLCTIWMSLLDSSSAKDEAKIRIYQKLMRSWSNDASKVTVTQKFKELLDSFEQELSLKRGLFMSQIWEEFRGSYPQSGASWAGTSELMCLVSEFDKVAFKQYSDADDLISELVYAICGLHEQILFGTSPDTEFPFAALKAGIQQLEQLSSKFLIKRSHNFQECFQLLFNFVISDKNVIDNDLLKLSHYAGLGASALLTLQNDVYPNVFDTLWLKSSNGYKSSTSQLFTDRFLQSVFAKVGNYADFSGDQLDQTIRDSALFSQQLIKNSRSIMRDRIGNHSDIIKKWYAKILLLVEKNGFPQESSIDALKKKSSEVEDQFFQTINTSFLIPALNLLSLNSNLEQLGQAWVLFSIGLIQLYVPDSTYDPAIEEHILFENFEKRASFCERLSASMREIRAVEFGDDALFVEHFCPSVATEARPEKPKVYRTKLSIDNLFEEWQSFVNSTLEVGSITSFLGSSGSIELERFEKQVELFQQNSSNFIERLCEKFEHFSDVNDIFKGYIFGLKLGFDLILESKKGSNAKYSVSPLWFINPHALATKETITHGFYVFRDYCKSVSVESSIAEQVFGFMIDLLMSSLGEDALKDVKLEQVFQALYYRWSLRRTRQEQKEAEEGSLFKYQDKSDSDEDFKEMFPDYEEFLDVTEDMAAVKSDSSLEDEYFRIAKRYISIFAHDDILSLKSLVGEGARIAQELVLSADDFKSALMEPANLASVISRLCESIDAASTTVNSAELDFYRGYSPNELKRSVDIVQNLLNHVTELLEQWPEHATLQNLGRISREYLSFPVRTPLARLIQKIEQIYTFIAEWEKYASSKVTLKENFDQLTTLIVSWRRLELSSWKSLFDNEDINYQRDIGKWWFNLFETIVLPIYSQEDDLELLKIVTALNLFISKSTYGQYESRLSLLKAFGAHVSLISSHHKLNNTLQNLITFYNQFLPMVQDNLSDGRKKLQKDVEEVILLASWKDVNIDALKQSARRSHQSLYKLVRKYRDLLGLSVTALIEQGLSRLQKVQSLKDNISPPRFGPLDIEESLELCCSIDQFAKRPGHLKNSSLVNSNMNVYKDRALQRLHPSLYEYAKELSEEMESLKKETPSVLNDETKKTIGALKTQKKKLLSDALREMKRIGLKTHLREDIHKLQSSANLILSESISFNDTVLSKYDSYFFRIVELLPRLRASVGSIAEDVSPAEAEKGLAVIENLVYCLIKNKKPLVQMSTTYERLNKIQIELEGIISTDGDLVSSHVMVTSLSDVEYILKWLPQVLNYAIDVCGACSKLSGSSIDTSVLHQMVNLLKEIKLSFNRPWKFSMVMIDELESFSSALLSITAEIQDWGAKNPTVSFVGDFILGWISAARITDPIKYDKADVNMTDFDSMLRQISSRIMVVFQKITAALNTEVIDSETDKWFILIQKELNDIFKSLHTESVVRSFEDCVSMLSKLSVSNSSSVKALLKFTKVFFKNYVELLVIILNKFKDHYVDVSRSTYMLSTALLNLAKDGFCSPEPPTETKENDNLQDGTGLGDGEGANNNSNDVEDDEDLSEQAQEPNKEKDDKRDDEDDNDDAVDIDGDMAGDLENLSDQDDDEDDKDDEDEDQEELDEEIDDLDDLDPNAVDDKMWDEEAKEDKKEKESENMPENSKNDDVQAKGDEDESNESKDDKNKNDQQPQDEDGDEQENDDDAEGEDDVGEQEDEVKNEEREDLDQNVPETETLDLPDDINLDSEEEGEDDKKDEEQVADEDFENMDVDEEEAKDEDINGDEDVEVQENEGDGEDEEENDADTEIATNEEGEGEENEEENGEDEEAINGAEEDPEDEGLKENQGQDENEDQAQDENGDQMEGLEGADTGENNDEDIDPETAVEQQSGSHGQGAQTETQEEQEDVGASGSAKQQERDNKSTEETNDGARDDVRESLKQLGDSLKEFHRRHQEIRESNEKDDMVEQKANERPDEFEHVDGENTENNTQALGAANKDQVSGIDDDMAIDDDVEEENPIKEEQQDVEGQEPVDEEMEEVGENQDDKADEFNGKTKGGFIGERKQDVEMDEDFMKAEFHDDDRDDTFENSLLKPEVMDDSEGFRDMDEARELWRKSELETQDLAASLCEQLRLILEPTLSTKLKGDYKTGKRLNMKRIISYIASDFRKDKIWLRRTKPSKRQYQIMIAVDDSKSMAESRSVDLAFQSICLVSKALTQLESGGLSIVKFGEDTKVVHPFEKQFSAETGAKIFQKFDFQQTRTDIKKLVGESIEIFNNARTMGNADLWQLQIIISDGVCEDHATIQRLVRRAREEKIMLVFVIIDGINSNESIMDMSQVKYVPDASGNMVLKVDKYLDSFPFEFYVVVHDIAELPKMLSLILRQYFSELAST
jgi:midasin